jgi:lipopolysaccharide transport system permease protein
MHDLVIEAGRAERQYWKDVWRYRELFYFLAWRDLLVRYKQTVAGASWAIIRPLLTMLVLTVVFGRLANMPSGGVPYPILVFCGLLSWNFFSAAVSECGNSLINNASLISKVYFPRLSVPVSSIVTSFVDMAISSLLLVALMVWYRYPPGPRVYLTPAFVLMALAAALGAGIWIAALMVKYRDVRFMVPFIVQFGLYVSPVGFTSDVVPAQWRLLYSLNPMVGIIDGFRWALLPDGAPMYWPGFLLSLGVVIVLVGTGVRYFRKTERTFADVI